MYVSNTFTHSPIPCGDRLQSHWRHELELDGAMQMSRVGTSPGSNLLKGVKLKPKSWGRLFESETPNNKLNLNSSKFYRNSVFQKTKHYLTFSELSMTTKKLFTNLQTETSNHFRRRKAASFIKPRRMRGMQ